MAWFQSGDWSLWDIDKVGHLLAELCYAINEREAFTGLGASSWNIPSPAGSMTYPVASDFNDMALGDVVTSGGNAAIWSFIQGMQGWIEGLLLNYPYVKWADSNSDETSRYTTIGQLLNRGSYGNTWLSVWLLTDVRIYLQMREALESMLYPIVGIILKQAMHYHDVKEGEDESFPSSYEVAWDNAKAAGKVYKATLDGFPEYSLDSETGWCAYRYFREDGATMFARCSIYDRNSATWNTDNLTGILIDSFLYIRGIHRTSHTDSNLLLNVNAEIIDTTINVTVASGTVGSGETAVYDDNDSFGSEWATLGVARPLQKLTITTEEPADCPLYVWNRYGGWPRPNWEADGMVSFYYMTRLTGDAYVSAPALNDACRVYYDISGDLTYG